MSRVVYIASHYNSVKGASLVLPSHLQSFGQCWCFCCVCTLCFPSLPLPLAIRCGRQCWEVINSPVPKIQGPTIHIKVPVRLLYGLTGPFHADDKSQRLPDEGCLRELAVEEGQFYVKMMDASVLCCCQCQQQSDRLHARYRRKDFIEVDALTLDKASGDEARLVFDNGAELILLDLVHLLQADRTVS